MHYWADKMNKNWNFLEGWTTSILFFPENISDVCGLNRAAATSSTLAVSFSVLWVFNMTDRSPIHIETLVFPNLFLVTNPIHSEAVT